MGVLGQGCPREERGRRPGTPCRSLFSRSASQAVVCVSVSPRPATGKRPHALLSSSRGSLRVSFRWNRPSWDLNEEFLFPNCFHLSRRLRGDNLALRGRRTAFRSCFWGPGCVLPTERGCEAAGACLRSTPLGGHVWSHHVASVSLPFRAGAVSPLEQAGLPQQRRRV